MSGKRIVGVVCLVLAALLVVGTIVSLVVGLGVSRAVAPFLNSLLALFVGLWLLKKPVPQESAESPPPQEITRSFIDNPCDRCGSPNWVKPYCGSPGVDQSCDFTDADLAYNAEVRCRDCGRWGVIKRR